MKRSLLVAVLTILTCSGAFAKDIITNDGKGSIVVIVEGNMRQFQYCSNRLDKSTCQGLGKSKWYSKDQLESEKTRNYAKAAGDFTLSLLLSALAIVNSPAPPVAVAAGVASVAFAMETGKRIIEANLISNDFLMDKDISSQNCGDDFEQDEVQSLRNILKFIDEGSLIL